MAIDYAATSAENSGTGATIDITYNPAGTRAGLGVIVATSITTSDIITGVVINPASDNISLTRVGFETATGAEDGAIYGYFYGGAIPAGSLTIRISKSDATTLAYGAAQMFTGATTTEVVDDDGISTPTNVADPQVTLSTTGRHCAAFGGIWAAPNAVSGVTELAGMTRVEDHDLGADVALVSRQTTTGTGDFTFGYTMLQQPSALIAFTVSENPTGSTGSGTPTKTLGTSASGTAVQKFVGTGAPSTALSAVGEGEGTHTLVAAGSFETKYVAFSLGTGAAASTVEVPHGLSAAPKVVEVDWNGRTQTVNTFGLQSSTAGRGFANTVSSIVQRCIGFASQHNTATASRVSKRTMRDDNIIVTLTAAGAIDGLAAIQSVDDTNVVFVINDQFSADLRVQMRCRTGDAITDVWVGSITPPVSTGTEDYTDPGFTCTDGRGYFQVIGTGSTALDSIDNDSTHSIGVATSSDEQMVLSGGGNHAVGGVTGTIRTMNNVEVLSLWNSQVGAPSLRAAFLSWIPDGFRLNWGELSGAASRLECLVIKGPRFAVIPANAPDTSEADVTIAGIGFEPIAGTVYSHGTAENAVNSGTADHVGSIGHWDSVANQGCHGWYDVNGVATSIVSLPILVDAVYVETATDGNEAGIMALQEVQETGVNYRMTAGSAASAFFVTVFEGEEVTLIPSTGTGAPEVTLGVTSAGEATQTFTGTGAPSVNLTATTTAAGTATQIFSSSGEPETALVATAAGTATQSAGGTGHATYALDVSAEGTATNTANFDNDAPPRRARGRRIVTVTEPEEPKKPKPKPKPVPEAAPLAELPESQSFLQGPAFDPELWSRLAKFRAEAPVYPDPEPEAPPEPIGERLMRQMMAQTDGQAFPMLDDADEFLEHFLRQLEMELD